MSEASDPGGSPGSDPGAAGGGTSPVATRVDPSQFVASDVTAESDVAGDHAAAEGAETPTASDMGGTSRFSNFKAILLQTDPSPPLQEVEDPWNPDAGGIRRVYRGLQKMAGFAGMPAIGDVLIGAAEWFQTAQLEGRSDAGDDSDDSASSSSSDADADATDVEATDADVDPITQAVRENESDDE